MPEKDWDKIAASLSSGEDSDEYDEPNIAAFKKNAPNLIRMVAQIMKDEVPDNIALPASKAVEAGKGTLPRSTIDDFRFLSAEIAKRTSSSSLPSQSSTNQAANEAP